MSAYACQQKGFGHPCFDKESHCGVGRMHLPVAPRCNIKCKYCSRRHDCANENRPGVTSRVISPIQALELVRKVVAKNNRIRVIGIAGPGDPLANEAAFETFRLIDGEFPELIKCLSTNGLLLLEKLGELLEAGVSSLTVTVNALTPWVGGKIYSRVNYQGKKFLGQDAAALLHYNQLLGLERAIRCGLMVKVNSVLIPGINDKELPELARVLRDFGVQLMNIMPLIPRAELSHIPPVPVSLLNQVRDICEGIIPQFRLCKQCRADAIGIPGEERPLRF